MVTASLKVEYAYADGSSNHVRPTKIVYSGGREVHYRYTGQDDNLSRVSALASAASGGAEYAAYSYLGLGGIVKVDYTEPDLLYDLAHGGGSDPYDGLESAAWLHSVAVFRTMTAQATLRYHACRPAKTAAPSSTAARFSLPADSDSSARTSPRALPR